MIPALSVVVHVLTVFWLVAGIVGRDLCYRHAAHATDLAKLRTLVEMGGRFERSMVRASTFVVLLTGLIAAWTHGWPVLGFLQGGDINWVLASIVIYLSIVPLIFLVFLPAGRVYRAALEAATAAGRVTPELTAALRNPAVEAGRAYELVMIAALVVLMVMKPF